MKKIGSMQIGLDYSALKPGFYFKNLHIILKLSNCFFYKIAIKLAKNLPSCPSYFYQNGYTFR